MKFVNWLTVLVAGVGTSTTRNGRMTRRNAVKRAAIRKPACYRMESLEDRSLLTPTIAFPEPNSQIFTRPGGNDSTWTYTTGTTPADGSVNRYPVTAIAYYNVPAFSWNLTRGTIEYATSTAGPWTALSNDFSNVEYVSVSGKVFRFVDNNVNDTTTSNNVGVGWQLGGGAPTGNVGSGTQVIPDNAPTDLSSNRSVILDDAAQGDLLATLTPTDTGSTRYGRWEIDSQSVANLFTINHDNTTGNKANLTLGTGTMPAAGTTVTVTARYYDMFQTDANNDPIEGQGFSKTLSFTVVANDTNSLPTFANNVTANTTTSNYQQNPAVATLSNGNYVVVWQSLGQNKSNTSVSGIYGQIFSNTGSAVGNEFLIANNSMTSDEINPVVTVLDAGRFAVAYGTKSGSNYEIGLRIIEANGTVGSQIIVNDEATGEDQYTPSIATLTDGSFVVSWVNYATGDLKLQQYAAANGSRIGSNVLVVATDGYYQSAAALSDGNYIVAWNNYTTNKISFRIGTGTQVDTTIDHATTAPRIAALGTGFVLVSDAYDTGASRTNLVAARYSNAGVLQGSSFAVSSATTGEQLAHSITALSSGDFIVAWTSSTVDQVFNGIAGRRFDATGTAIDTEDFQINQFRAENQIYPAITALANDGFATAWAQQPDIDTSPQTDIDVVTRVFNVAASSASVNLSVSASSGTEVGETQITITATADSAVSSDETVDIAVTGTGITTGDYSLTDGDTGTTGIQIKIPSGQTTGTVTFTIANDTLLEGTETATLTISNPTSGLTLGASTAKTVEISDDEAATLDIAATSSVTEAGGSQSVGKVTLTITGSGTGTLALGPGISLSADITDSKTGAATSETDYSDFGTQSVTFSNEASTGATASASLSVTNDGDDEGSETIDLSLGNLTGSSVAKSLGATSNVTTIADDDTPVPEVSVSLDTTSLKVGSTANVTFTFNTLVTGFDNNDITVANGTLSSVSSSDGGTTWTATFTPDANTEDASNLITVDESGVLNSQSVPGVGSTDSENYTIDTKRPTASIVVTDTALRIGETTTVTITFNEAVTGLTTAGLSVGNGTVSKLSSSDGGQTWTATLTPTASVEATTNLITLDNTGIADVAGNVGSGTTDSNNYAIDTIAPTVNIVDISPDPRTTNAGVVSINFSENVTGVDIADFTLTRDSNVIDIGSLSVSGSGSAYMLDLTSVTKAEGSYVLTLNAMGSNIVDSASNDLTGDASDTWDRVRPTVDLSVDSASINEGSSAVVTATLSAATEDDVTINVTIGGTANGKNDYTTGSIPLTITAGKTTATLAIDASEDTLDEPSETVTVTLGSLTNASSGSGNSISVEIVDTDSAPITAVATNGVLVITVVQAVPTDSRVTFDSNTQFFVVGSYTEGVLATTFLIDVLEITNGTQGALQGVLGTEADFLDLSAISLTTVIQAGNGNDTIRGSAGADSVDGGDGDDLMQLGGGADTANGGAGDDVLRGGGGADVLVGDEGADSLFGQGAVDTLNGGTGVDHLDGGTSPVAIIDDFADVLAVTNTGYSTASGTAIAESISYLTLTGSAGADSLDLTAFNSGLALIHGGDGNDTLTGSDIKDILDGDGGHDVINGGGGDDNLQGGLGLDVINGGDGNDTAVGGGGHDTINGDAGDDVLRGNSGNDLINGGIGNDSLYGSDGDDVLTGGAGDDRVDGEVGNDRQAEQADVDFSVSSQSVSSTITGTDTGRNLEMISLQGGVSANRLDARFASVPVNLLGGAGNDTLLGGSLNDTLRGGSANDVISGGAGDDIISGGSGTDIFTERLNVDATITGIVVTADGFGTDNVETIDGIVLVGLGADNTFNASASSAPVTLLGGNGNDTLIGSIRGDVLVGGNRANPAAGTDSITGGTGIDILDSDPNDVHVGTGDSAVADVFALLPSWIDAV